MKLSPTFAARSAKKPARASTLDPTRRLSIKINGAREAREISATQLGQIVGAIKDIFSRSSAKRSKPSAKVAGLTLTLGGKDKYNHKKVAKEGLGNIMGWFTAVTEGIGVFWRKAMHLVTNSKDKAGAVKSIWGMFAPASR